MTATLSVDSTRCMGHGRCYAVAFEFLAPDDEGFVTLRGASIRLDVDQISAAREAVDACPESAIVMREGP